MSGGIGAELSGGNFWQGAVTGGIVAGLNHVLHRQYPPDGFKGESYSDNTGDFTRREDGSYSVKNSSENIGLYKELDTVELKGKSKTTKIIDQIDKAVTSVGIVAEFNESLVRNQGKGTIGKYAKVLGTIGKSTGVFSAGFAIYEAYKNPSVGNILKAQLVQGQSL